MTVNPSDIVVYGSNCMPAYDGAATLNGAISSTTATTLAINTPTSTFPASGEFPIQIDSEILWVTQGAPGGTAGTLTVIRGMFGTSAATHSNAAAVTMPAGAGVNFLSKVSFSDIGSGDTADYVSSSASDTLVQISLTGRDTTGAMQTETKTLNGTTIVNGSQVWDRFLRAGLAAGTTTSGTITSGGTTLAVVGHANFPTSGNYNIQLAQEIMTVTAGQNTNSWTVTRGVNGTTATAHNSGDNVYLLPVGDVAILDHTKVINGHTAQTGSANASSNTPPLFKLQSGDGVSMALGQVILITSGTGAGQLRSVIGLPATYGTDIVAVSRNWSAVPDNTSVYSIYNGMLLDTAPNQVTECKRFLYNASSDVPGGSTRIFYEEVFIVDNNTSTAATNAQLEILSNSPSLPAGAALDIALTTSLNSTVSWVNRQTAPGSGFGSFVVQPAFVPVPANSGTLSSGAAPNAAGAEGACLRLTLPAGASPYKGAATLRTNYQTI